MRRNPQQQQLFEAKPLPDGVAYVCEFITPEEEAALLDEIRRLPLHEARLPRNGAS